VLEGADAWCWKWYGDFCGGFAREFGFIPGLIAGLGFEAMEMELFVSRMGLIHETLGRISAAKAQAEAEQE
jgi:hypothetical protein